MVQGNARQGPPTLWHQCQLVQNPLPLELNRRLVAKRKKPVPEGPCADDGVTASRCGLSGTGSRKKPVPEGPLADDGVTASRCGLSGTGSRKKPVPEGPCADDGVTASRCGLSGTGS